MLINSFKFSNNNNQVIISPIQYIGNNHPYKLFYIFNLCISSSLFISNYTIAKTSIFLYIIYIINNNIFIIIIISFFIIYPLLFIFIIHPFIVTSINNNIIHKSNIHGVSINNITIVILTFLFLSVLIGSESFSSFSFHIISFLFSFCLVFIISYLFVSFNNNIFNLFIHIIILFFSFPFGVFYLVLILSISNYKDYIVTLQNHNYMLLFTVIMSNILVTLVMINISLFNLYNFFRLSIIIILFFKFKMNKISFYRNYSTTILLSPAYSIGFCASIFIFIQIISGYVLASNYIPHTNESFDVIHNVIMRELDTGWLIRFNHVNGCALLFIVIYIHMFRSLYHNSISKTSVWVVGILMYILLCGIAFTGYSLVYGQMSLWAIVVICSLVTAIPFIGNQLLILIWGGNIVSTVTLQRIFCIHYLLPLLFILFIMIHLLNLHNVNSTGDIYTINNRYDRIHFYPLLLIRDVFIGSNILILYNIFVFYYSDLFGHPDNYVPANPLVTPSEIMPEFYLLPFYALIRAIPHKVLGIIFMVLLLLSLTNLYPISILRFYNHVNILHRTLLVLLLLDLCIASILCLYINHYESFYFLLILSILSLLSHHISNHSSFSLCDYHAFILLFTNINSISISFFVFIPILLTQFNHTYQFIYRYFHSYTI
jgi:quinol-cytochrome oxidoreductase complex cytochrome b subunit